MRKFLKNQKHVDELWKKLDPHKILATLGLKIISLAREIEEMDQTEKGGEEGGKEAKEDEDKGEGGMKKGEMDDTIDMEEEGENGGKMDQEKTKVWGEADEEKGKEKGGEAEAEISEKEVAIRLAQDYFQIIPDLRIWESPVTSRNFPFTVKNDGIPTPCIYTNEKFPDVFLKAGEKKIPAHRLILGTHSEYFDHMFSAFSEMRNLEIDIKEVNSEILEKVVKSAYFPETVISDQSDFFEIMRVSDMLQMRHLFQTCLKLIPEIINSENCGDCLEWMSHIIFYTGLDFYHLKVKFLDWVGKNLNLFEEQENILVLLSYSKFIFPVESQAETN
jgi:hypothetical protein